MSKQQRLIPSAGGAMCSTSARLIGLVVVLEAIPAAGGHRDLARHGHGQVPKAAGAKCSRQSVSPSLPTIHPDRKKAARLLRDLRSMRRGEVFRALRAKLRWPSPEMVQDKEVAGIAALLGETPTLLHRPPKGLGERIGQAIFSMLEDAESKRSLKAQIKNRLHRMHRQGWDSDKADRLWMEMWPKRRNVSLSKVEGNTVARLRRLNKQLETAGLRGLGGRTQKWLGKVLEKDAVTARIDRNLPRMKEYVRDYRLWEKLKDDLESSKEPQIGKAAMRRRAQQLEAKLGPRAGKETLPHSLDPHPLDGVEGVLPFIVFLP